jgi:superfamily II DNA or RNA helicase
MGLSNFPFKTEYRSGYDDLIRDLYHPALKFANRYWRAVGYFSSSALEAIGQPLGEFIYQGGVIRLISSVELQEDDLKAIEKGLSKQQIYEHRLLEQIRVEFSAPIGQGALLLGRLLEAGRLEIRIVVPKVGRGIYHEKVGIFLDNNGDYVAFSGSSNESRTALESNYECVDVYTSWEEPQRANAKKQHFELLWGNKATGAETFLFPEAARLELIRVCRSANADSPIKNAPPDKDKWRHQSEAIKAFLQARHGILEMATGSGKTRTALEIIQHIVAALEIDSVIVASDGNDLLDQWTKQLYGVASSLSPRFRVLRHYRDHHQRNEYILDAQNSILITSRESLHKVLRRLSPTSKSRLFIIHDEVHGYGSPANVQNLEGLSDAIPYRLGLSATPEREYDSEGSAFIERNVGPVVFRFPLEEAIRRGILCEFDYLPIEYAPSDEDRKRLQSVHRMKAVREAEGRPMSDSEIWTALARVYKTSLEKIPLFEDLLEHRPEVIERCIVFVAEREYGDQVLNIIHRHRYDFHTYYHEDDKQKLEQFAKGEIACLITCHRISEGIDIRSLRSIILFSSDRTRLETIQRIGRCLRVDPNDAQKRAIVVDFIRKQDPDNSSPNSDQLRRKWLTSLSQIRKEDD